MLWLAFGLILIVSIAVLAYPLLRPGDAAVMADDTRMRTNVQIYQQRLAEIDEELSGGKVTAQQHAQLVAELKRNLLDAAQLHSKKVGLGQNQLWVVAGVGLLVPVASVMLYFELSPQPAVEHWAGLQTDLTPKIETVIADPSKIQSIGENVDTHDFLRVMQHYLHAKNGSAEGWALYAQLMGRFEALPQATIAARKAYKYAPDSRQHALTFAQFELASNDGAMTPRAERVLREWAVRAPDDPGVLMLLGMGFFNANQWANAIDAWEPLVKVLDKVPSQDPQHNQAVTAVKRNLAEAKARLARMAGNAHAKAGMGPGHMAVVPDSAATNKDDASTDADGSPQVTVEVHGDPKLLADAPASAQLFIFAKAESGPPMPLAVKKLKPTQWPVRVTLTPEDAMMPAASLGNYTSVQITARWSESGQIAMGSSDPLVSVSDVVNPLKQPVVRLILPNGEDDAVAETGDSKAEPAKTAPSKAKDQTAQYNAQPVAAASGERQITVSVSGQPDLLENASSAARLFVFAKAASGPPMPLAVKRVRPESWPVTLTLTESDAMMPASTLAQYDSVIVSALWSENGQIPMGGGGGQQRAVSDAVNPQEQPSVALSLP